MKTTQPATRPLPRNAQPIPDSAFILCSCGNRGAVHSTGLCLDCMEAQPQPKPQPHTRYWVGRAYYDDGEYLPVTVESHDPGQALFIAKTRAGLRRPLYSVVSVQWDSWTENREYRIRERATATARGIAREYARTAGRALQCFDVHGDLSTVAVWLDGYTQAAILPID